MTPERDFKTIAETIVDAIRHGAVKDGEFDSDDAENIVAVKLKDLILPLLPKSSRQRKLCAEHVNAEGADYGSDINAEVVNSQHCERCASTALPLPSGGEGPRCPKCQSKNLGILCRDCRLTAYSDMPNDEHKLEAFFPSPAFSSSSQITTTTGMYLSLERYNELSNKEKDLMKFRQRTLLAIRAIYRLTGISDFNEIQRRLEEDDGAFFSGIPLPIEEGEKSWMVELAHSQQITLGDWVRKVFFEAAAKLNPSAPSPASPPTQLQKEIADAKLVIMESDDEPREWSHEEPLSMWVHKFGLDMAAAAERLKTEQERLKEEYKSALREAERLLFQQEGWTPCSEKLPTVGELVDVVCSDIVQRMPARLSGRGFACADGYEWDWADESADPAPFEVVSHWRKRPTFTPAPATSPSGGNS